MGDCNALTPLTRVFSRPIRPVLLKGFIITGVVCMMMFVYENSLSDEQYTFIAATPLPVTRNATHNLRVSLPHESEIKKTIFSRPARLRSTKQKKLLQYQRQLLAGKLHGHTFNSSLHVNNKSNLIPTERSQPIRNLIVSTWRSGSSFLASVVSASLGTFLFYEPFMGFEFHSKSLETSQQVNFLNELFHCNFTNKDYFFKVMKKKQWAVALNKQFWIVCKNDARACITESYHEAACRLFPSVLVKTVRLMMNETRQLLQDDSLQLRALLLVRDPRGSMASRYRASSWCMPNVECGSEDYLCDFLESNYYSTKQLMAEFPGRVKVVRYEDIMLNPYATILQIFDFFRLTYGENVHNLLQKEDRYSANSSVTHKRGLYYWTDDLTFEQVSLIQSKCEAPLQLYGYKFAHNATHLIDLDPLDNFSLQLT